MEKEKLVKALENYFEDCKFRKRLNNKTIKAYKIDLNQFFETVNNLDDEVKEINEYIYFLNKKNSKHKTVKRKLASVKAFYSYLEYEEIIEYSPFNKVRTKIKEPHVLPKTIQKENIEKIIQYLFDSVSTAKTDFQKKISIRNIAIIGLLFSTGIRISELCNIKVADINFNEKALKIFGKGSKERILYIGNETVVEFCKKYKQLNENVDENDYFFLNRFGKQISDQSVRIFLKNIESELKLTEHITPHMFRHTFATMLLEKDVDIRYIQSILGHTSISTTQIYTHVAYCKQKEIMGNKNPISDFLCDKNN